MCVFDYTDDYSPVTKIFNSNVLQILFCQYFMIILSSNGEDSVISSYQLDDDSVEMGLTSFKNEGKNIIIKTDGQSLYVVHGAAIGKFSIPGLDGEFLVDTPHTD